MISVNNLEKIQNFCNWFFNLATRNAIIVLLMFCIMWQYFQISELKKEVADLQIIKNDNIKVEKRLNALSSEIIIFKASTDKFPFPYWIKDLKGKIIYVNEAFVQKYLRPKRLSYSDYVGHTDMHVFAYDEAKMYAQNDSLVLANEHPMTFTEKVGKNKVTTVKFPYFLNGVIVGVAGVEYEKF